MHGFFLRTAARCRHGVASLVDYRLKTGWRSVAKGCRQCHQKTSAKPLILLIGAPEEIRTPDPQIRSLVLYPAELRARFASLCASRMKIAGLPLPAAPAIAIGFAAYWQAPAVRTI
jgi:hypothetical protein